MRQHAEAVQDPDRRRMVHGHLTGFLDRVRPGLEALPHQIIHNDANDHNIVVRDGASQPRFGIIDFGDAVFTLRVAEPAIAMTYLWLGPGDGLARATAFLSGYHRANPLEGPEVQVLFDLVLARLCVSVLSSAVERARRPDDAYLAVSEAPAWSLLTQLTAVSPAEMTDTFLRTCLEVPDDYT